MTEIERKLDKELDGIISKIDGAYEVLSKGVRAITRKTGKAHEVIVRSRTGKL
jgi:hypothetical protein